MNKSRKFCILRSLWSRISCSGVQRTNESRRITAVNCRARKGGGSSSFPPSPRVLQEGSRDLIKARRRIERRVATSCKLEPTLSPPSSVTVFETSQVSYSFFMLFERISLENSWERCTRLEHLDLVRPSVCVKVRQATRISSVRNSLQEGYVLLRFS